MYSSLSQNTFRFAVPLLERPAFAKRAGLGGIDLPTDQLISESVAKQAREAIDRAGVKWGVFVNPVPFDKSDEEFEAGLAVLRERAPWARLAGCTRTYEHVWPGSKTLEWQPNFDLHVKRLRRIAQVCRDNGITFGLEFLGPAKLQAIFTHKFVRTIHEMLTLIDAIGPGVGLVLDVWHLYTSGGSSADLAKVPASVPVVYAHLDDAPPGIAREEQSDGNRLMPLESGILETIPTLQWLAQRGFDGPVIAEPFSPWRPKLEAMPADDAARTVAGFIHKAFAAAGVR